MHPGGFRSLAPVAAFAFALLLAFTGCADRSGPSSSGPSHDADARFTVQLPGDASPDAQGLTSRSRTSPPTGPMTVSQVIDGSVGGQITLGRFTLTIPAGAFSGTRPITVEDPNNGYLECHLYPEGATFDVPVFLTIDLVSTALDVSDATIYWFDPQSGEWLDQRAAYSSGEHKVTASLHHFSAYRGGRAGW